MDRSQIQDRARTYIGMEEDPDFRTAVEELLDQEKWEELADRFYTDLEFGTGGLRGVIGGGFNRMNPLVVQRATEGLARYVEQNGEPDTQGVLRAVIAHDSRRYSDTFALTAALVFAAHGIKVYLFSSLRPTPELSFAVRHLNAAVGIVVTASHNPPQYNGYKVYWADGAQIVAPHDTAIIAEVRAVDDTPRRLTKDEALSQGLLEYIDTAVDDAFVAMVKRQSARPQILAEHGKNVTVVFTPLHGTGAMMVERVLGELGVTVITVPEQREPDGEFPTVEFPNPEEAAALELAIELGTREQADIVMGTDPDADRLGIAVPGPEGFTLITGNQLGALLVDYIFGARAEAGTLPDSPVLVKTVVTTELQRRIAEHYGATVFDTLTGFKHIATVMRRLEDEGQIERFILGDEESYGYLIGTEVRDKDAITAVVLTTEMCVSHVSGGKSVLQRLEELYRQFGYFEESTISRYFTGASGKQTMASLMAELRSSPPQEIGTAPVVTIKDYLSGETIQAATGERKQDIDLPSSNVLQFLLADGTVMSARPSGTEPKIKFYASVAGEPGTPLDAAREDVKRRLAACEVWITATLDRAESL